MKYNELDETRFQLLSADDDPQPTEDAHDLDEGEFRDLADRIGLYDDIPVAADVTSGFFMPTRLLSLGDGYNAWYRGWYGNRWCPKQSKFGGPRKGGVHMGADLAVPMGTPLFSVVGPASIQWNPKGSGGKWGNHIFLNFTWNDGNNYTFVYAHLQSLIGSAPREVNAGETICTSGCTGNAGGSGMYCGTPNRCGGISDHLHLELFGPRGRIDPISWLSWNIKFANDTRCGECTPRESS